MHNVRRNCQARSVAMLRWWRLEMCISVTAGGAQLHGRRASVGEGQGAARVGETKVLTQHTQTAQHRCSKSQRKGTKRWIGSAPAMCRKQMLSHRDRRISQEYGFRTGLYHCELSSLGPSDDANRLERHSMSSTSTFLSEWAVLRGPVLACSRCARVSNAARWGLARCIAA
jgi:hypothetical protein